jgi:cytochrome c-type biogenesis protein CcmH/NrfF
MKRREAIGNLFAGLVMAGTAGRQGWQDDTLVARLSDPSLAGKSRGRVTDHENDPFVVGIEGQLRCTCGCNLSVYTCRTTDFTCETSPALHQQVIALTEEGKTEDEILTAFMAQYGETVLMSPPKRGFNLAAYTVPGLAILTAAALLIRHLTRRNAAPVSAGDPLPTPHSLADARLASELDKLEL